VTKSRQHDLLRVVVLSVVGLAIIGVPLWLVVVNSFKTFTDAAQVGIQLPTEWALIANYSAVIEESHYLRSLGNSLFITGVSVVALLGIGAPAAWAFARSRSRLMAVLYWLSVIGVLLPLPVVPLVFLMREAGLQGTQIGLILYTIGSRLSLVVFLMTGFVRGLPQELEEAAAVDGASRGRVFVSVVLPLMRPVMLTPFVILLVVVWNDFYGPLILTSKPELATLPIGLYQLSNGGGPYSTAWNYVFTHVVLVSLPLIIVYTFAQRRIVAGVTSGALRG
jgi:raffinose/stachyose/melibiose transport system permease protein